MLNQLLFNNSLCQQQIRILRFFAGVMLAIILAFAFDWPFAFITPVFVAKFLGGKKQKLPFKALLAVLIIILAAFILAGMITRVLLPYPIVFLLVMTLLIFWISYWNNSGGNELVITMLLVGFTVIPMLGLLHQAVAEQFTIGFIFSCFISLVITMVIHELIADIDHINAAKNTQTSNQEAPLPAKAVRVRLALLSTLMIMPVMAFFFYFSLSSSVLILAFIAMLAQKPDLVAGVKGSKALLVGNGIGAIIAIAMYNVLLISPTFAALILLFSIIVIFFAQLIFSTNPLAPLFAMAFATVIILISSATGASDGSNADFYTRIVQIGSACAYIIFVTILASPTIQKISKL